MYHFIFIAVDSSQSFSFPNNGKTFICGLYSKSPSGGLLNEIDLQLKELLKFRLIFLTDVT